MTVTSSQPQNITSPNGNSLAVFVDGITSVLMLKDVNGKTEPISNYISNPIIGLFAQTQDSTPVTATTSELSLISNGVGSLSVPENGFSVGDSFVVNLSGNISAVSSATLRIRVKASSGVILCDSDVIPINAVTNRHWKAQLNFTIRNIGVAGVASISSTLLFQYTQNAGLNFEGYEQTFLNNTTFDTTVSNTLEVTAKWNTNNSGNSISSSNFVLTKTY